MLAPCFLFSSFVATTRQISGRPYFTGKDAVYSPEVETSPAPSSNDPQQMGGGPVESRSKQSSRGNSFEIENLLKTAGEVRIDVWQVFLKSSSERFLSFNDPGKIAHPIEF